jgi:hypothetical protein
MAKKNNSKNTIDKPHDKALFSALRNHNIARDAIKSCFPAELLEQLDLHAIKPYRTKMVSPCILRFIVIIEIAMIPRALGRRKVKPCIPLAIKPVFEILLPSFNFIQ